MAGSPQVAIDQQGDITSIWSRSNGTNYETQTAYRPAGGSWQVPVTLSETGYDTSGAQIAVDSEGDAAAVWETFPPASNRTIQAVAKSHSGTWSAPVTLADIGEPVGKPQIAIDSHGDAVAVWEEQPINPGPQYIQAAVRPAGGVWSAPVDVSEGNNGSFPNIAMDAEGNAIVTWLNFNSIQRAIRLASTGTWQVPTNVAAVGLGPGGHPGGPVLAVDEQGDAIVAWSSASGNGANHIVYAASLSKGGSWQAPAELSGEGFNAAAPHVGLDPQGDATVVWSASEGGGDAAIQAAVKPAGGAWQPPTNIVETGEEASNQIEPDVAVDREGNAVAVWEGDVGGNRVIQAARRSNETGDWQVPIDLSATTSQARYPKIKLDSRGNAVAVWEQYEGSLGTAQAAGYDVGPLLNGQSIPSTGTVGQSLSFSASPMGVWSTLGETKWSFGDGSGESGTSVTHTYAAPGNYTVTLSSVDALGNLSSTSTVVTISPARETKVSNNTSPPPMLSGVHLTNKRFRVAKRGTALTARRTPAGTAFHFTMSVAARLTITIKRTAPGLHEGRNCVRSHVRLARAQAKRCTRTLTVGTLTRANELQGTDSVDFSGRIGSRPLSPHDYKAILTASNSTSRSKPITLAFEVVPG